MATAEFSRREELRLRTLILVHHLRYYWLLATTIPKRIHLRYIRWRRRRLERRATVLESQRLLEEGDNDD